MVLLLERGLKPLLRSTTQRLDICSYGVLISCITYTKQLLLSLSPYSGSTEMSYSSYPISTLLLLDLSANTIFPLAVGMLEAPLPESKNYVV
jgi:hypothetical protein